MTRSDTVSAMGTSRLKDDLLIAVVNGIARLLFHVHSGLTILGTVAIAACLVPALVYAGYSILTADGLLSGASGLLLSVIAGVVLLVLACVGVGLAGTRDLDANPFQRQSYGDGFRNRLAAKRDGFMAWMSHVKCIRWPFLLVLDPVGNGIKGEDVRQLLSVIKPGDILLRGHRGYVEGLLISLTGTRGNARRLTHAAVYIGDTTAEDEAIVAADLQVNMGGGAWRAARPDEQELIRTDQRFYQTGPQRVLHAMALGVFTEDILSFVHCDYMAVIRLTSDEIKLDPCDMAGTLHRSAEPSAPGGTGSGARDIEQRLTQGEAVPLAEILAAGRRSVLGKIGSLYDFQFDDVRDHNTFSCSSLAYYCLKSVQTYIGLVPTRKVFMGRFFARDTITPADLYEVAARHCQRGASGRLQIVWESASLGKT
jgi:hypothetical protein